MKTTEILEKMYQTSDAIAEVVINSDANVTFEEGVNLHQASFKIENLNIKMYFGYATNTDRVTFGYGDVEMPIRQETELRLANFLNGLYISDKLASLNREKARIEAEIEKFTNNKQA